MNYQCCKCHGVFPHSEAIDGFKEGYKVGFLCPLCGSNIKDDPFKSGFIIESKGYAFLCLSYMLFGIFIYEISTSIELYQYICFGAGLLILLVYGYFKHPDLFNEYTVTTQMVKQKNESV